jgi:hypothetical protein
MKIIGANFIIKECKTDTDDGLIITDNGNPHYNEFFSWEELRGLFMDKDVLKSGMLAPANVKCVTITTCKSCGKYHEALQKITDTWTVEECHDIADKATVE